MVPRGLHITIDNVCEVLRWLPEFGVVVCSAHGYALRSVADHLRHFHEGSKGERQAVVDFFTHHRLVKPRDVQLPAPLGVPFTCLGKPRRAFICDEPECERITVSRDEIRKHCNKDHGWRATKEHREHWHQVWVQTFFNAAGLQRYFTVQYEQDEGSDDESNVQNSLPRQRPGRDVAADADSDITSVLGEWNAIVEQQEEEMDVADRETAKTDHTLWFKRTQWPEHLKNCNLRHLSHATRLPDREEEGLRKAVEVNRALIERCVAGLSTLDDETRRWLRSAKQSEPDVRPLGRLQNRDSQQRYTTYMSRLICYTLRVLQSEHRVVANGEQEESSSETRSSEEDSDDDSDSSSNTIRTRPVIDVLSDARRLFPWRGNQKDLAKEFFDSLTSGASEETQQETLLTFYESGIFRNVRGDRFENILLHFLAVLGIDEEQRRLRQANDFSYMLAGVVYCVRVLAIEMILPSAERDEQSSRDDRRFRRMRDEFLADGSYSPMSKMLSMLAYSKSLAYNHVNAGAVFWSEDRSTMTYKGSPITLSGFRGFVNTVVEQGERMLWQDLLFVNNTERFEIPLDRLRDDVTFTKRGVSFIDNEQNGLQDQREFLLRRALSGARGSRLRRRREWAWPAVRKYLRAVDRFRELLLLCVHCTGGQPARGTEITSIRFRNGFSQDRNVFIIHGQVVVVTRYHKSQSQLDKPKVIPRFLPWRIGQLLAVYLVYVQPFQEYLTVQIRGGGWSDYVWASEKGPWETDRLTRVIARETQKNLGTRLTTHDYRHVAISIGREVVGAAFAKGYQEGMDEGADDEAEEDADALEFSAGRGGEIGANRYGVSLDVIIHLSNKTVDTFRPLSAKWHTFLGLSSSDPAGRKRTTHIRGASTEIGNAVVESERRASVRARNSQSSALAGVRVRWEAMQSGSSTRDVDDDAWFFGGGAPSSPLPVCSSPLTRRTPPIPPPSTGLLPKERSTTRTLFGSEGQTLAPAVSAAQMRMAMQQALRVENVEFRSEEQKLALEEIVNGRQQTPLVVVLPTGGGKSLLFMAPACLDDAGVTIVVVPYRALINDLVAKATSVGIDSFEWRSGMRDPAALVFISADVVSSGGFMGYAQLLSMKGLLRRVFVDECHLIFTSSDWRPKLAQVLEIRKLRCPTIMLTATLPVLLECELEEAMVAQFSRYIRAETTRRRTRYIVHKVKRGRLEEEALGVCRRMKKHLGLRKGVVYCRSRDQCETMAAELGCAYYHAGADDNEERLRPWLSHGGLIVATSALGTGVDFPGIVFVLHVDLPYGMIDFTQESGRAGRAGEDVDSVIIVEEGTVERGAVRTVGIDDTVMGEFVTTEQCRRAVMSVYLDGRRKECGEGFARCDNCGEGLIAVQKAHAQAAQEQEGFERQMDELVDVGSCLACFVGSAFRGGLEWEHAAGQCSVGSEGARVEVGKEELERFRGMIRFAKATHSCFKCGFSQKLCRTGQDSSARCQWTGIMVGIVRRVGAGGGGLELLRRLGFEGEWGEWKGYTKWLGERQARRIWGEVMSNAMAVLTQFVAWRAMSGIAERQLGVGLVEMDGREEGEGVAIEVYSDEAVESEGEEEQRVRRGQRRRRRRRVVEESASDGEGEGSKNGECSSSTRAGAQWRVVIAKLREWDGLCIICKALYGRDERRHLFSECPCDSEVVEIMKAGAQQVRQMKAPRSEQGRCWVPWVRCIEVGESGRQCKWSELAGNVAIGLLYVGREKAQVQSWVAGEDSFREAIAAGRDGLQALEECFRRRAEWVEVDGLGIGELILQYA